MLVRVTVVAKQDDEIRRRGRRSVDGTTRLCRAAWDAGVEIGDERHDVAVEGGRKAGDRHVDPRDAKREWSDEDGVQNERRDGEPEKGENGGQRRSPMLAPERGRRGSAAESARTPGQSNQRQCVGEGEKELVG